MKTIVHWAQAVRSPRPSFRMFDYGVWCLDWRLRTQVRELVRRMCSWSAFPLPAGVAADR